MKRTTLGLILTFIFVLGVQMGFSATVGKIVGMVTDKETGKLAWVLCPDYSATEELRQLKWIIGQHHAHMIPRGLPGEGNILIFDNGGWAGYGSPNPGSPKGFCRSRSRRPALGSAEWRCNARLLSRPRLAPGMPGL